MAKQPEDNNVCHVAACDTPGLVHSGNQLTEFHHIMEHTRLDVDVPGIGCVK